MRLPPALADLVELLLPGGCIACGSWIPSHAGAGMVCGLCRTRLSRGAWPRCPRCHLPLGTGRAAAPLCRECITWPEVLASARWAYVLEHPADALVHALKYQGWRTLADEMGAALARVSLPPRAREEGVVVVPVPTTVERMAKRGYNQAEELAKAFAGRIGRPVVRALERTRSGATQVALHPSERRANVMGAFAPKTDLPRSLEGVHTILVDDVLTTGATAGAAASALAGLGVSGVTLLTFARALPFRRKKAA